MSISQQAQTAIDIYDVEYPRGSTGAYVRTYTLTQSTTILYLDNTETIDKTHKQRREQQMGIVMSEDPLVWENLHDCCVINGTQFRVCHREDLGSKGLYFWFSVEEDINPGSLSEYISGGGLVGGVSTASFMGTLGGTPKTFHKGESI